LAEVANVGYHLGGNVRQGLHFCRREQVDEVPADGLDVRWGGSLQRSPSGAGK
jgi:hypothetical protein